MEIIVDGYNLIGRDGGLRGALEHKRNWLMQQLAIFREQKNFEITVVFDGWQHGLRDEAEEKRGGVKVIFSRLGEKADSVIIRLSRARGSGCVVVTSDREIRNVVEKFGVAAVTSGEFAEILRDADGGYEHSEYGGAQRDTSRKGNPRRLSKADKKRSEILRKLRS
ncbi:MAG: NYN domain-containing protein [Alphaproteobacteria bacterium]